MFKKLLGITGLEKKLVLREEQVLELARGQVRLIGLALKQPGISVEERQALEVDWTNAASITNSSGAAGIRSILGIL